MNWIGLERQKNNYEDYGVQDQETIIRIRACVSIVITRSGERQVCFLSSYLFNIFIEKVIQELKIKHKGVKINRYTIHCIRFADSIIMVTTEKDMQHYYAIIMLHLMKN